MTNGNFRSYGGITAASHGVSQNRDDWALSATQSSVWGTSWVNEARGQIASQDQQTLALDPRCGGPCTNESAGGPEIIIPGVATLGRNIYEPTDRDNWRLQVSDIVSHASVPMVKAGALHLSDQRARRPLEFGGSFTVAPLPAIRGAAVPVTALEAFALGLPAPCSRVRQCDGPFAYKELSALHKTTGASRHPAVRPGCDIAQIWPAAETTVTSVGAPLRYPFPQDFNLWPRPRDVLQSGSQWPNSIDAYELHGVSSHHPDRRWS